MLGETALDHGFYHVIVWIALVAMIATLLDYALSIYAQRRSPSKSGWRLPMVNVFAGLGLLSISAIPWAHFNVGHPLSDEIYKARALIAPEHQFVGSGPWPYGIDEVVWRCDLGACDGDPKNTESIYHHRHLDISFRYVLYSECMSPEFNLATAQAIDADITDFDGDRRRTARAFFDGEGRIIGPNYRWFTTPLMWSQLSELEKRRSPVSFDSAMTELAIWNAEDNRKNRMPAWTEWEDLSTLIISGDTEIVHRTSGLLVGIRLKDGSEYVGTQTRLGDLDNLLTQCGVNCEQIDVAR